jgi:hypothetical protein
MSDETYILPKEVDDLFRWPRGRAKRLAIAGAIEHVLLPDGDVRFERHVIDRIRTPRGSGRARGQLRIAGNG